MKIKPYGDQALLVEFDKEMDLATSQRVIALFRAMQGFKGVKYLIPAYHTLTIGFENKKNVKAIYQFIEAFDFKEESGKVINEIVTIPVCYELPYALDMKDVQDMSGLSKDQIIEMHCGTHYHVFMLGFLAGFAYMGQTNELLNVPRKQTPRLQVPQGAVGLAGNQTGIYPTEAPGGWQIIGQTPIPLFDPKSADPTLLEPGGKVKFRPISLDEYKLIEIKLSTGIYQKEMDYA